MTATIPSGSKVYEPHGAAREVFMARDPIVLLDGPAGTGQSRAALQKIYVACWEYPECRWLMLRKTRHSMTQSTMVTFDQHVTVPGDGVAYHHGKGGFVFPNGSIAVCAGLDKDSKVMSAEYDGAYIQEATEVEEANLDAVMTRLRNGKMPYQQCLLDCNPSYPAHWLNQRANSGAIRRLWSRHQDNPRLWDAAANDWTDEGRAYIAKLDLLTGVRKKRLRDGIWAAAEGIVFDGYDPDIHVVPAFEIPADWPRYRSIDFGFTHPFVCQWWAVDPDGRLYRYRELYGTQRLVSDWAKRIRTLSEGERILATVADHDAEGRATLNAAGIPTVKANKAVIDGIQAVQGRLARAADGKPRLYLVEGALVEKDRSLSDTGQPTCTDEEIEAYVWDMRDGRIKGEVPVKEYDHGCDAARYLVMHFDGPRRAWGAA
jgi:PBSX family phage terminase large subunit